LGKLVQTIDDQRDYCGGKLLAYLAAQGAELVESSRCVGEGASRETDMIDRVMSDISGDSYGGRSYYLYWYKGCLIELEGRENEMNLDVFAPTGHPLEVVHREFEPFLAPRKRAAVSVLLNTAHGMMTKSVDFEPPVIDDLELNYGTGFAKVDKQIVGKLQMDRAGIVLMHGVTGGGKSTYIRHLTSRIDKEFIFIPVGMAGEMSGPSFLGLLLEHQGAILVLEDAEQALQSREVDHWNSSNVSTILNLGDGVLGEMLQIKLLCTYNADRQTLDPAILRKGRLLIDHRFGLLSTPDARRLAKALGKDEGLITEPTSLADVYNQEEETGYVPPVSRQMGFGAV
jgi:hypothetical protein